MSDEQLLFWLRLGRAALPPQRAVALIERFGSPEALFDAPEAELRATGLLLPPMVERLRAVATAECGPELAAMERLSVVAVPITDPDYPALLKQIYDPPPVLYRRGTIETVDDASVAIVGTRRSSHYGRGVAERFGRDLAAAGITVVSGMALGADTAAHRGAIAGGGRTIAVWGSGLDVTYPTENRRLAEQIVEHGALLSEAPMGAGPEAWRFPARNRIISGLSLGILVVEASEQSGAMITARFAAEHDREVFAVPGSIDSPLSRGPHALLRDGARLVESVADILEELRIPTQTPAATEQLALPGLTLSPDEERTLDLLSAQPRPVDDLIAESGLTAGQISSALMMLEVKGLIRKLPGNSFVRLMGRR